MPNPVKTFDERLDFYRSKFNDSNSNKLNASANLSNASYLTEDDTDRLENLLTQSSLANDALAKRESLLTFRVESLQKEVFEANKAKSELDFELRDAGAREVAFKSELRGLQSELEVKSRDLTSTTRDLTSANAQINDLKLVIDEYVAKLQQSEVEVGAFLGVKKQEMDSLKTELKETTRELEKATARADDAEARLESVSSRLDSIVESHRLQTKQLRAQIDLITRESKQDFESLDALHKKELEARLVAASQARAKHKLEVDKRESERKQFSVRASELAVENARLRRSRPGMEVRAVVEQGGNVKWYVLVLTIAAAALVLPEALARWSLYA